MDQNQKDQQIIEETLLGTLNKLQESLSDTELARTANISPITLQNLRKQLGAETDYKPQLKTLVKIASGLSNYTNQDRLVLLNRWFKQFDLGEAPASVFEELNSRSQVRRGNDKTPRPSYTICGPGMPCAIELTYTSEEEGQDKIRIGLARDEGGVFKDALYYHNRMSLTKATEEINFTEAEAMKMELQYHLQEMRKADSLHDLLYACAHVCKTAMPKHPACESAQEGKYANWFFRRPDNLKLSLLGETTQSISKLLSECCIILAKSLVLKLREKYVTGGCSQIMDELEKTVTISGHGWNEIGITPAEALMLTQQSMLIKAKQYIEDARLEPDATAICSVIEIQKKWGFSWADVCITPEEAARLVAKSCVKSVRIPELREHLDLIGLKI